MRSRTDQTRKTRTRSTTRAALFEPIESRIFLSAAPTAGFVAPHAGHQAPANFQFSGFAYQPLGGSLHTLGLHDGSAPTGEKESLRQETAEARYHVQPGDAVDPVALDHVPGSVVSADSYTVMGRGATITIQSEVVSTPYGIGRFIWWYVHPERPAHLPDGPVPANTGGDATGSDAPAAPTATAASATVSVLSRPVVSAVQEVLSAGGRAIAITADAAIHAAPAVISALSTSHVFSPAPTRGATQFIFETGATQAPMRAAVAVLKTIALPQGLQDLRHTAFDSTIDAIPSPRRFFRMARFGMPWTLAADSLASFVQDSVLKVAIGPQANRSRAWFITLTVLSADAMLLTYYYRKTRQAKALAALRHVYAGAAVRPAMA